MPVYRESDVPAQTGKTILVTGANTGLGYHTTRVLAQRGARVLLGCRSEHKAEKAITEIRVIKSDANVTWVPLDLANLTSVKEAADLVNQEERLDALINNAGVMIPPKRETADGFELQFGVNHLGHFALTGQLISKLQDQPHARIVTVTSLGHRNGKIDYDDVHAQTKYNRLTRYNMSKLANVLFTYELQRKLEEAGSRAIAVACHPGLCTTELLPHAPRLLLSLSSPLIRLANSSAEGALPTLLATTGREVKVGDYFGPTKMMELKSSARKVDTSAASKNKKDAKHLWELSTKLTGTQYTL